VNQCIVSLFLCVIINYTLINFPLFDQLLEEKKVKKSFFENLFYILENVTKTQ
jgi:hypothetical protein